MRSSGTTERALTDHVSYARCEVEEHVVAFWYPALGEIKSAAAGFLSLLGWLGLALCVKIFGPRIQADARG